MRFDHFNFLAPIYDRLIHTKNPDQLIKLASLPASGKLLDAGGGTGRIADILKSFIDTVVVADLSFQMLRNANHKDRLLPACVQAEFLPFPDHSFERVVMVDALHHVFNAKETCLELWRVLKPGGIILIEEPDIRTLPVKLVALVEKLALMRSHFFPPNQIAAFFNTDVHNVMVHKSGYTAWIVVKKDPTRV